MVGLPARGKTYISYKVSRYLAWLGVNCRVFNVGTYRRKMVGAQLDHSFFDPTNQVAIDQRLKCATMALQDMFTWFKAVHNGVAIYDATNSTRSRRKMIMDECRKHNVEVMFCESWCDDNDLVDMNIREVKRTSPDYKGVQDIQPVMEDFRRRIGHYSEVYEPVGGDGTRPIAKKPYPLPPVGPTLEEYDERQVSYLRKINVGSKMVINRIASYLESRIVYFVMNIHIATRSILFSRHGESMYNLDQRLGGDPCLSPNGRKYAEALPSLISKLLGDQPVTVWTSTLKRTAETAAGLPYKKMHWKALDELDAGLCDGLTYEDVERMYPEEYAMRDENKFEFRYRGGESYRDVVLRLEPVIMELERQQNIMIISHQAVLRCIYAYFLDIGPDELPYLKIPLHTVMKLTWTAYGCDVQMYKIDIDAVSTHRAKPKAVKKSSNNSSSTDLLKKVSTTVMVGKDGGLKETPPLAINTEHLAALAADSAATGSPSAVSDTWEVDAMWTPVENKHLPLPTPPTTHAPPSVIQQDETSASTSDKKSAFLPTEGTPNKDMAKLEGMTSRLSVSGGHETGDMLGDPLHPANVGHIWPTQISPGISRVNSRPESPDHLAPNHHHPNRRSDPRSGSPVYLSPENFASSYAVHDHDQQQQQQEDAAIKLASSVPHGHQKFLDHHTSSPTMSEPIADDREQQPANSAYHRQPLISNMKIDELHVAGHGNVDVVESTPTITLRYSSNVPAEEKKHTAALKNTLVGLENDDEEK